MSEPRTMLEWLPAHPEKGWNYLDILGKTLLLDVMEAYEEWGLPGDFVSAQPTEVQMDGTSYYMDVLVELALREPVAHWRAGQPPAERALAHFEVTDRLREELRWRALHYRTAKERDNQFAVPLRQYFVVAGNVPVAGRVRDFGQGWDDRLQPFSLPVFYIDELPFHRWSELDPTNPHLRTLAIMPIMLEGGDPEPALRAAARTLLEWEGPRGKVALLLHAVVRRNDLMPLAGEIIQEEKERKMLNDLNYTPEEFRRDFGSWFEEGETGKVMRRAYIEPEVTKGIQEGLQKELQKERQKERQKTTRKVTRKVREEERQKAEQQLQRAEQKWQREKHRLMVARLLDALSANSIRLVPWQKTALRKLPCESLPSITVARKAKDAADFARRAGLRRKPNGGGNGKG